MSVKAICLILWYNVLINRSYNESIMRERWFVFPEVPAL